MRYIFTLICLAASSMSYANTYDHCKVDSVLTHEAMPNLVTVTLSCTAPDAFSTGSNCVAPINANSFIFDTSTVTGKNHMALILTALAVGNDIHASTYAACSPISKDTLWLYALRLYKQ